ncbi:hypothetical protein [Lutibacter sp.]|uniref:hypothetical protein n=1 Tax=Lutibacter sp. TaxID=1925666 RepID=UPI0035662610
MSNNQPIKLHEALQRMRELTELNIPFSFGFYTCNTTNGTSDGYKVVSKGLLRVGYRDNQSGKANVLIGYIDVQKEDKNRWFYIPLLMMFNGVKVIP